MLIELRSSFGSGRPSVPSGAKIPNQRMRKTSAEPAARRQGWRKPGGIRPLPRHIQSSDQVTARARITGPKNRIINES